jgi:hypothetical protein
MLHQHHQGSMQRVLSFLPEVLLLLQLQTNEQKFSEVLREELQGQIDINLEYTDAYSGTYFEQ